MDIQSYIKEVVFQIADGINDIITEQKQHNVIINPAMTIGNSTEIRFIPVNRKSYKNYNRPVQLLRLDIRIQTTEGNQLEVEGGINLSFIKGGGNGTESAVCCNTNRVGIAIPISFPNSPINECES